MTTIFGIVSAAIFFRHSVWWAMATVLIVGFLQWASKSSMNVKLRANLQRGMSAEEASRGLDDFTTLANMMFTFVVWGLTIYALVLAFR